MEEVLSVYLVLPIKATQTTLFLAEVPHQHISQFIRGCGESRFPRAFNRGLSGKIAWFACEDKTKIVYHSRN